MNVEFTGLCISFCASVFVWLLVSGCVRSTRWQTSNTKGNATGCLKSSIGGGSLNRSKLSKEVIKYLRSGHLPPLLLPQLQWAPPLVLPEVVAAGATPSRSHLHTPLPPLHKTTLVGYESQG